MSLRKLHEQYEDVVTELFEYVGEDGEVHEAEYAYPNNYWTDGVLSIDEVEVSDEVTRKDWEAFMAKHPDGYHSYRRY